MSITPAQKAEAITMALNGSKQSEIAKKIFPNQTPQAGQVSVSRLLNSADAKQQVAISLAKHDITIDKAIAPIADALQATKVVITGSKDDAFAEVIPDHNTRLKAGKEARDLLGVNSKIADPNDKTGLSKEEAEELANASDEVELSRIVFKKGNTTGNTPIDV